MCLFTFLLHKAQKNPPCATVGVLGEERSRCVTQLLHVSSTLHLFVTLTVVSGTCDMKVRVRVVATRHLAQHFSREAVDT